MSSEISQEDYRAFKEFLQDASGILLGDNKQYLVKSRLRRIMTENRFNSLGELVQRLRKQPRSELRETVIDAMTTNETLWFRDTHPFRILEERLLGEMAAESSSQPLRIWSAACSTGQEPYSIAMVIDEYRRRNPGRLRRPVEIIATDVSKPVVDAAKDGIYELLALGRGLSADRQKHYFTQLPSGSWQVRKEIRDMVTFREHNLLERFGSGRFDIVFCRNVLIYFSSDLKHDILVRTHGILKRGGYLILGASESLNGLNQYYEMVQCRPGIIYRAK
ncbi:MULTISPECIES: CheR family methyltransferase [Halomonadaceae]|uniref:protein-glutamate O-methyltransferase n=1 Tax=Vreelandella halophila TaxID=86177 RepID=A0A9X4YD21_9GAMM|nr:MULTISPECIES: protein-glutamate O-methyltransferase CheR [Halomonas]MYL27469.1 chemotaxis protein [Halomonas utahensis]MYL74595.1 chemotaxis protein [Halomonas sp. 22501_18_FS]